MDDAHDILITGLGVVSPIGVGRSAFWEAFQNQQSGVRITPRLAETDWPVRFGAEVLEFDAKQYIKPRKSIKVMCREVQMGFAAAAMAMEEAGLAQGDIEADRFGVVYGSEMLYADIKTLEQSYRSCMEDGHFNFDRWGPDGMPQLYPLWMLMFLPNMVACHVGIAMDARGPNNTIVNGDASSLMAVEECVRVMRRGAADVMIVGGVGSKLNLTPMMYRGSWDLSRREDEPERASRPFDAERDGSVNGEGSAAFVLETRQHAKRRGATPICEIIGTGSGFEDRHHSDEPTGSNVRNSIQAALRSSGLSASEIGHVNAHGLSTAVDDRLEANAIHDVLGDTPVIAPKSLFGNLGAGTGAVEMAASVLGLVEGELPPARNYETPDPNCPVNMVTKEPLAIGPTAIALNQSTTGQASAVVIRKSS